MNLLAWVTSAVLAWSVMARRADWLAPPMLMLLPAVVAVTALVPET